MAVQPHFILGARQAIALGDANLLAHQVDVRNHFGHRMFDLKPGVHLDEIEFAVLVEEFDRAGAAIAHVGHRPGNDAAHMGALFGGDDRGGCLLDHLLVATLDRTVALAKMDRLTRAVTEYLEFDMLGIAKIFFHVDGRVAEGGIGLRRSLTHQAL